MRGDIIDTREDPFSGARERRRRFAQLAFPFLTALLLVAAIAAITLYTAHINRRDALELTDQMVHALQRSVRAEVAAYLAPTKAAVTLLAEVAAESGVSGRGDNDRLLERAMRQALRQTPPLAAVFVGDTEGDFVMVQRADAGVVTKLIAASGGPREVRWVERAGGVVVAEREEQGDTFDPATRPWFADAVASDDVAFSHVYRFFTSQRLGVTVSVQVETEGELPPTVAGADLELDEIGRFLDALALGAGSRAGVVGGDGTLVAVRGGDAQVDDVPTIDGHGDRVLAEAFERFRINRASAGFVYIDGRPYVAAIAPLADLVRRDWWLFLLVPEESAIGFVADNTRTSLALSSVVVLLAMSVAALLTLQGLQSDARAQRASRSERAVRDQQDTLEALAALEGLVDPADEVSLRRFATVAADAAEARRVAIWWLSAAGDRLVSVETYDREAHGHTAAATLPREHLGAAWEALTSSAGLRVSADDHGDTASHIRQIYLRGVGSEHLDVVPITRGGRVLGSLWFEDANPEAAVIGHPSLVHVMARMIAPRLERMRQADRGGSVDATAPEPLLPTAAGPTTVAAGAARRTFIAVERDRALLRRLREHGGTDAMLATLHPRVAVLHLDLGDALALAGEGPADAAADQRPALATLAAEISAAAEQREIAYLKLLGSVIVAADGFEGGPDGDVRAATMADFALAVQPACRTAERHSGRRTAFRMGLDIGAAFGASVGFGDVGFNLWGDASRLAQRMAESAPPGAIQVSQAAYDRLGEDFLLRRRGSFFIDGVGETDTYILAGRL